mmetsp:Transcript_42279/g.128262  ORF Transcript_42279/g.128262 Transcript_42279/m.128262 type:complete len:219 (-) Transcript_42279:730-1386(-)
MSLQPRLVRLRNVQIELRPLTVGTPQIESIERTGDRIDLGVGRDATAIVAIPPFIVLGVPRGKGDARQGVARSTGGGCAVPLEQYDGSGHDGNDADDDAGESSDDILGDRPASTFLYSEEIGRYAFHRGESAEESEDHPSQMRKIIHERCQSQQCIHHHIQKQENQYHHVPLLVGPLIHKVAEQQAPIHDYIGEARSDQPEDTPGRTHRNIFGQEYRR